MKHRLLLPLMVLAATSTSSSCCQAQDFAPIGRHATGSWNNLTFDIFYYVQIDHAFGPSKMIDCVVSSVEAAFVNTTAAVAMTQVYQIQQDYAAANGGVDEESMVSMEEARVRSGNQQMQTSGIIKHMEDDEREGFQEPTYENIKDQFHHYVFSTSGGRGGLIYRLEMDAAVYVEGEYLNNFDDILNFISPESSNNRTSPEAFRNFIAEELRGMVTPSDLPPGIHPEILEEEFGDRPLGPFMIHNSLRRCIDDLDGDFGEDPTMQNTTIIGRATVGEWEGQPYEILSFFEIFNVLGLDDEQQEACFYATVDALFVEPYLDVTRNGTTSVQPMTSAQKRRAREILAAEEEYRATLNYTQLSLDTSIVYEYSQDGGSSVGSEISMSLQRGGVVFLNGSYIRTFEELPAGFEALVPEALDETLKSNITSMFPPDSNLMSLSEDFMFREQMSNSNNNNNNNGGREVGSRLYVFLLPELVRYCKEPPEDPMPVPDQPNSTSTLPNTDSREASKSGSLQDDTIVSGALCRPTIASSLLLVQLLAWV